MFLWKTKNIFFGETKCVWIGKSKFDLIDEIIDDLRNWATSIENESEKNSIFILIIFIFSIVILKYTDVQMVYCEFSSFLHAWRY